ncbi:hypothetical protein [uncultured Lutibacter sp.]|uniref:hypothetical protein n=1 Tax=uncultured Lutibacter sp. TaxID=437739 RepID=UPI00260F38F8|nr:hypothetical protein [uncultured Lutibacter sp.]
MTDFTPPIKERKTEELLEIIGTPENWNPKAIKLAESELRDRKVDKKKIETAKYISKKIDRIKRKGKANESIFWDLISEPFGTIIIILFSWELKKDGFDRKAREQKIIRIIILSVIIIVLGLISLNLI